MSGDGPGVGMSTRTTQSDSVSGKYLSTKVPTEVVTDPGSFVDALVASGKKPRMTELGIVVVTLGAVVVKLDGTGAPALVRYDPAIGRIPEGRPETKTNVYEREPDPAEEGNGTFA